MAAGMFYEEQQLKTVFYYGILIPLCAVLLGCQYFFATDPPRKQKPYDSQKAGAEIIESYDFSEVVQNPITAGMRCGIAADEHNFYARIGYRKNPAVQVIEKSTMRATRHIRRSDRDSVVPSHRRRAC
jgi:hypothetical protein